jgi:hypothetical protein
MAELSQPHGVRVDFKVVLQPEEGGPSGVVAYGVSDRRESGFSASSHLMRQSWFGSQLFILFRS